MSNRQKHRILLALKVKYDDGEERTVGGHQVTDLGRSLTTRQLNDQTGIKSSEINTLCRILINSNQLVLSKEEPDTKAHWYRINDNGIDAVNDMVYLNKLWYRNPPVIISLGSFLVALFALLYNSPSIRGLSTDVSNLSNQVQILESKVKSLTKTIDSTNH